MRRQNKWKPGYAATITAVVVPLFVLIFAYRPAVDWFAARNSNNDKPAPNATPTLPVTGLNTTHKDPGFPWWAFAVILTVLLMTLFLWSAGHKNILAASSRITANAAERRARSYTFDADVHQRLDEGKSAKRLRSLAGSFARTALALKGTSQVLDRIESVGTKLDLPPVGEESTANLDAQEYQGMPPRLDSLAEE